MWAWGPRCKELFAGSAPYTAAFRKEGWPADEPVELFEDPIRQKGRKPCCDLADPKIRAKVDRDVEDLPGPDTANVYVYTNPCTTFCSWQLLNTTTAVATYGCGMFRYGPATSASPR